jgi:hypothetical protein
MESGDGISGDALAKSFDLPAELEMQELHKELLEYENILKNMKISGMQGDSESGFGYSSDE